MKSSDWLARAIARAAAEGRVTEGGKVALPAPPAPAPALRATWTEADFTRAVIAHANSRGWAVAHFRPAMTRAGKWVTAVAGDGAGFPDLVLVRGKLLVAELKVKKNRPTPAQVEWLDRFRAAGIPAHVWRPADWADITETLT